MKYVKVKSCNRVGELSSPVMEETAHDSVVSIAKFCAGYFVIKFGDMRYSYIAKHDIEYITEEEYKIAKTLENLG